MQRISCSIDTLFACTTWPAFFQEVGLPAKSGVGGGVFLVIPQLMGICIFSPRLDKQGNSVRGIEMAKQILSGSMSVTEREQKSRHNRLHARGGFCTAAREL